MSARAEVGAKLLSAVGFSLVISACSNPERRDFVSSCVRSSMGDASQCECLFNLGAENLSENQMELFIATLLEDEQRLARARTKLGIMSGAAAVVKIGWVMANAGDACGIK